MPIDFTLTREQKKVRDQARDFAENVLAPVVAKADAEPDPWQAFLLTKPAYVEAYRAGLAFGFLPREYGGQGASLLDVVIASEEVCAVDPGFGCTLLCNALGYMPVLWFGSDKQKDRFLRAATSDRSGEYIAGYMVSEPPGTPGGTANFDCPLPRPAGLGVLAERQGDSYVLNGRKKWPGNVTGWDLKGANGNVAVVRTDPNKGGAAGGLSAIVIERDTPGITYKVFDKLGHRLHANAEVTFDNARVPAENLLEGAEGNGDLVINRAWGWTGPVSAIAAVAMARAAYEAALKWAKTYTGGGPHPIIHYQNAGYLLGDVAARIEMCRAFCWKAAHYIDTHDGHGEFMGAFCKPNVTELMFEATYRCMQVVGVNSYDLRFPFAKYLREATLFPIYDAGNMGMQRRRLHGVLASPDFNPRAVMDNDYVEFKKAMEAIDTVPSDGSVRRAEAAVAR
jgi:acyl-CoA dehydrogenase